MACHVTIDLPIQPGKTEEFLAFIKGIAPDTRAYEGCQLFDICVDQDNPNRVLFYEIWDSRPAQEKYLAWRTETGLVEQLGGFLSGPPSFGYFDKFDG